MKALVGLCAVALAGWTADRASVEQTTQGRRPAAMLVTSFDGLGVGFVGPHGAATGRNPSDNSIAVGPGHIVQIVNSRLAVFTKDGKVLYGAVPTNILFRGFGGACEVRMDFNGRILEAVEIR